MSKDPTQKELIIHLVEQSSYNKAKLESILEHVKLTNGRVTKSEDDIDKLNIFKTRVAVYGSIALLFVPYFMAKYFTI